MNEKETTSFFGLLRHGETEWNRLKKIQGSGNSPLTAHGKQQTAIWAKTLNRWPWHRIHASDLGRVRQTVEILNASLDCPLHFDARLREQAWGAWEGLSIAEIKDRFGEELRRRVAKGWEFSAPQGETRAAVRHRVFMALEEFHKNYPNDNILIVCHHGVIKTILYHLTGRPFMPEGDPLLEHNKFHLIEAQREGFAPLRLNIAQHEGP